MPTFGFAEYTAHTPNPLAQMHYLRAVIEHVPDAWRELVELPDDDDASLLAWADWRGFNDPWALDMARDHRADWREHPDLAGMLLSVGGTAWEPVMPEFGRWNPFVESKEAVRARFERYLDVCEAMPGMVRTPPDKRTGEAHFEWLALHHAGHLTYQQIANRSAQRTDPAEISRAIRATAALVGLTLRPGRGRKLHSVR